MMRLTTFQSAILVAILFGLGGRPAAHAASTPPVTHDLILAYDGTQVTTNGAGQVSSWTDQAAGYGVNNADQATANNRPIIGPSLNGYPTVVFDGTDTADGDFLANAFSAFTPSGVTIFTVVRRDAQNATGSSLRGFASLACTGGQTALYFFKNAVSTVTRLDYNGTSLQLNYSRITDGSFHVVSGIGAAGTGATTLYADGLLIPGSSSPAAGAAFNGFRLGWDFSGTVERHAACALAEVLVYTNVLTFAERHAVESYLGQKYGLEYVPASAPPATDLPVTAGLQAHFDADYALTNFSGLVYGWESRTLNNIYAYQETAGQLPSRANNARYEHAAVRFNPTPSGNDTPHRLFTNYTPEATSNLTVFVMLKRSGNPYTGGVTYKCVTTCGEVNGTGGALYSLLNSGAVGGVQLYGRATTATDSTAFTTTLTDGNFHIATGVVTNGVGFEGWFDGTNKFSLARGAPTMVRSFAIGGVDGSDGGGVQLNRGFSGDIIAEIIYNRALTDAERQSVEAYLWDHYGPPHGTVISTQ